MENELIAPLIRTTRNKQERIGLYFLGLAIGGIFSVIFILQDQTVKGVVGLFTVALGIAANYLIVKYSSWQTQYCAELKKLGYEKESIPEPVGTLGVFRKGNELYVLHIISEGVVANPFTPPFVKIEPK